MSFGGWSAFDISGGEFEEVIRRRRANRTGLDQLSGVLEDVGDINETVLCLLYRLNQCCRSLDVLQTRGVQFSDQTGLLLDGRSSRSDLAGGNDILRVHSVNQLLEETAPLAKSRSAALVM